MTHQTETGRGVFNERWTWLGAILLAGFFLATSMYIGSKRLFWFDEIATHLIVRLPNLATMWKALLDGADILPITYYAIVRVSERLLGQSELAARFPSAAGLAVGMLLTFDCARRLTNGLYGLIAQAILTCSFLPYYGYEARPYGLFFMFASLALWLWLNTEERSRSAALAFGAVVFLATAIHYYFILSLVPYAAYEAVRWRLPAPKMSAGVAGAGLALLLLAPQILATRSHGSTGSFWANPSLGHLQYIIPEFFPTGLFLLSLIMVWIAFTASRDNAIRAAMAEGERLSWFFVLIPFAGYVLARFVTHAFFNRYFIGVLPGLAVAFSCLLYRHFDGLRRVSCAILALLATYGMAQQVSKVLHPERIESFGEQQSQTRQLEAWEDDFRKDGKPYIAMESARLLWIEAWYYSKHPEQYAVIVPPGPSPWPLTRYYPSLKFWSLDDLKVHAHEAVVVEPGPEVLQTMTGAGFKTLVRSLDPLKIIYFE